jgi:hypothetical protein
LAKSLAMILYELAIQRLGNPSSRRGRITHPWYATWPTRRSLRMGQSILHLNQLCLGTAGYEFTQIGFTPPTISVDRQPVCFLPIYSTARGRANTQRCRRAAVSSPYAHRWPRRTRRRSVPHRTDPPRLETVIHQAPACASLGMSASTCLLECRLV